MPDIWEQVAQARDMVEWTEKVIEQQRAVLDDFVGREREERYWIIRNQERRLKLMREYLRDMEAMISNSIYGPDFEKLRELG